MQSMHKTFCELCLWKGNLKKRDYSLRKFRLNDIFPITWLLRNRLIVGEIKPIPLLREVECTFKVIHRSTNCGWGILSLALYRKHKLLIKDCGMFSPLPPCLMNGTYKLMTRVDPHHRLATLVLVIESQSQSIQNACVSLCGNQSEYIEQSLLCDVFCLLMQIVLRGVCYLETFKLRLWDAGG